MAENTVSASAIVDAPPAAVFEFIRRPENHAEISGDGSVQRPGSGPDALSMGDKFGMSMKMGMPYRISSKVVEFEENAAIAWCHLGKHRWRWELEAVEGDKTKVTETYDQSTSPLKPVLRFAGYPARHAENVKKSVENVAAHFAG
jgi:uncharacterized protein YndB with AHSA1/START domain